LTHLHNRCVNLYILYMCIYECYIHICILEMHEELGCISSITQARQSTYLGINVYLYVYMSIYICMYVTSVIHIYIYMYIYIFIYVRRTWPHIKHKAGSSIDTPRKRYVLYISIYVSYVHIYKFAYIHMYILILINKKSIIRY
jgi:hypothetical protein